MGVFENKSPSYPSVSFVLLVGKNTHETPKTCRRTFTRQVSLVYSSAFVFVFLSFRCLRRRRRTKCWKFLRKHAQSGVLFSSFFDAAEFRVRLKSPVRARMSRICGAPFSKDWDTICVGLNLHKVIPLCKEKLHEKANTRLKREFAHVLERRSTRSFPL